MTPEAELNYLYHPWLAKQINYNYRGRSLTPYGGLLIALWNKPFAWTLLHDENRMVDGLELRYHFLQDEGLHSEFQRMQSKYGDDGMQERIQAFRFAQPCTTLEVLIALSRRLAFQTSGTPEWWAWRLIVNLDLAKMRDPITPRKADQIEEILDNLIWRKYHFDGTGGFFPLAYPEEDQRKVEIWYQMAAYIAEFGHP